MPASANCSTFGRGEGYPGDADFGLPPFAADIPPFDTTRVVHLGDGLNPEEFRQVAENVGQFLDIATATAGSLLFDSDHQPDAPEMASAPEMPNAQRCPTRRR